MSGSNALLLIDPDENALADCRAIFHTADVSLESAHTGAEALSQLARRSFAVLIADMALPDMSGLDFLEKVRAIYPEQALILTATEPSITAARCAFKQGADDFIPKPLNATLRETVAEIHARNRRARKTPDLMATLAHDVISPVSTIQSSAQALYGGYLGVLTPGQKQELATILRNCSYLEDIIRCHINWAEIELKGGVFKASAIDLRTEVIEPVIERPEYRNNPKSMKIHLTSTPVPPIQADAGLLRIVINNLLNNAIKYGREGSTIHLDLAPSDQSVVFRIQNEGCVISAQDIEHRLFQRFVRLKQKGSEGVKGCGLGLYLCKQIITKHSGQIEARSGQGDTVEFCVTLPTAAHEKSA